MSKITLTGLLIYVVFQISCTPKLSQESTVITSTTPEPTRELGPCSTFDDAPDKETALNAHVIYRDYLKQNDYEQALPYWRIAFKMAPAADGQRNTHFADGIRFFEHFYAQTMDSLQRELYIDTIFMFYDRIESCYKETGYVSGRKAFDLYYKYKGRVSEDEIYALFKKSMDVGGEDAYYFVLNPFTDMMVRRYFDKKINFEEAKRYEQVLRKRLTDGLASGENKEQWQIIQEYLPQRLEAFEGVKDFYDCTYYVDKYWPVYIADSMNCETIGEVYGKLRWGGCLPEDDLLQSLVEAGKRHCITVAEPTDAQLAYQALRNGEYEEAVKRFQEAIATSDDSEKKANYLLVISKIYYRDLKDFPLARKFALDAAALKPNWGEPYLLIGRLYASSGPLCGPGRGWDSQIVVWPAIDKWNQAKRVDPSVTAEANKWINNYARYMPSFEDIFQRNLGEGQTFRVGCWIQENTTIRVAKD